MIQETKEQQQMYNLFRSFIYIFLIMPGWASSILWCRVRS